MSTATSEENPVSVTTHADGASGLRYEDVIEKLIEPLPSHLIEVRPGATTRDKKSAIALAYYDWRLMVNRLNRLVGGRNWTPQLRPWGDTKIICTLTILGVSKDSSGEGEEDDENGGTTAEQQAKKRAMAEHGLNYLYLLPQVWGDYDADKKRFVNPRALVEEMYRKAHIEGLDLKPYISSTRSSSSSSKARSSSSGAPSTPPESSPPAVPSPTAEAGSKKEAPAEAVSDITRANLKKLSDKLGKSEPDYTTLTSEAARKLLNTWTNEYRATLERSKSPVSSARSK